MHFLYRKNSVAPQIQPGICFFKYPALFHQPFRDISGHAKKPVSGRSIYSAIHAFLAGAFLHPIRNTIDQLLGIFQGIGNISHILQRIQHL